jgi:hypothetical protein
MRKFAEEVSRIAHDIGKMDTFAEKVASDMASFEAQSTSAKAASALYDVIAEKAASETSGDVAQLVEKMAGALKNTPVLAPEFKAKVACVVAIDHTLGKQRTEKTAKAQAYGREFFSSLLREVL